MEPHTISYFNEHTGVLKGSGAKIMGYEKRKKISSEIEFYAVNQRIH